MRLVGLDSNNNLNALTPEEVAAAHNHSAADITSGTLAIARGGTGATSAAAALTALGAAAASHTHTIANVTGLQSALDGKQDAGSYAPVSHTHTIADVTGLQSELTYIKADAGAKTFRQQTQPTITGVRKNLLGVSQPSVLMDYASGQYPQNPLSLLSNAIFNGDAYVCAIDYSGYLHFAPLPANKPAVTPGETYTLSFFVSSDANVDVIPQIYAETPTGSSYVNAVKTDYGNGLVRYSHTWVQGAQTALNTHINRMGGKTFGAFQLDVGAQATAYQRVTSATDFAGSGLPVGSVWYQTDANDDVIATHRWDGSNWIDVTNAIDLTGAYAWTGAHTFSTAITGSVSGNAGTASKLQTSRTVQVNLASTNAAGFDGSANITPGVTGVLPVANGGTGANNAGSARTNLGVPSTTGSGASGTWAIAVTGNSAGVTAVTNLRGVKPNTSGQSLVPSVKAYFASKEMLEGAASGSRYGDFLLLDTYSDGSGGTPNGLFFDKKAAQPAIYHYRGTWDGEAWDAPLKLAYDGHAHVISDITGLQSALDGKQPAGSYAPASHTHTIANVTGLQSALDGKASASHTHSEYAAASHNHSAADITSGTLAIARGGTGATTAAAALTALGAAAASHTHAIVDVTGLQAALDGKQAAGSYAPLSHTHAIANVTGLQSALDGKLGSTATAAAATKLATARTINGTAFDGTANITTANWGTARTVTIGSAGKSVNGSANVSWTLAEIGAAPATHTHAIADVTGLQSALDGKAPVVHTHAVADVFGLQSELDNLQYNIDEKAPYYHSHAIADVTGLQSALDGKQPAGSYAPAAHTHSEYAADTAVVKLTGNQTIAGTKTFSAVIVASGGVTGNASSSTKLATARTIRTNLGITSTASFDGTANITPGVTGTLPIANGGTGATTASAALTALGAAAASHTHTIANVTGLQDALDGKQAAGSYAPASHTHTIANVSGLQGALDAKANSTNPTISGQVIQSSADDAWVVQSTDRGGLWRNSQGVMLVNFQGGRWDTLSLDTLGHAHTRHGQLAYTSNPSFIGNLTTTNDLAARFLIAEGPAPGSQQGHLAFRRGGFANWIFGTEASGDLSFWSYDNSGAYLNNPVTVRRSDGAVKVPGRVMAGPAIVDTVNPVQGAINNQNDWGNSGVVSTCTDGGWAIVTLHRAGYSHVNLIHAGTESVRIGTSGNAGGLELRANGDIWRGDANNRLNLRYQPRIFVQSGDPGGAATDGDLWVW